MYYGNILFCFVYPCTAFNLDFYTEVMDLTYLLDHLAADPFFKKFHRLNLQVGRGHRRLRPRLVRASECPGMGAAFETFIVTY